MIGSAASPQSCSILALSSHFDRTEVRKGNGSSAWFLGEQVRTDFRLRSDIKKKKEKKL